MAEEKQFYKCSAEDTLKALGSNAKTGLTLQQVEDLTKTYGLNELAKEEGESIWEKIKEQFEDILVRILILAALVSFVISQFGMRLLLLLTLLIRIFKS